MQYDKVIYKIMLLLNLNLDSHSTKCSCRGLLEMFVKLQSSYLCQNVDQNVDLNGPLVKYNSFSQMTALYGRKKGKLRSRPTPGIFFQNNFL